MVNLGNDEIVKYPFLAEAGKYLSDKGFSLEQFGTDPDLKKIVENAFERIITASEGRIFKSDFSSNNSALPHGDFFIFNCRNLAKTLWHEHTDTKIFSGRGSSCRKISRKRLDELSRCYKNQTFSTNT